MIRPLEALIQQLRVQAPLGGALGDQAAQRFGLKVVRTGTARKNAPVFHELQAQIVDPAVGVEALFGVLLRLMKAGGSTQTTPNFRPPSRRDASVSSASPGSVSPGHPALAARLRLAMSRACLEASRNVTPAAPFRAAMTPNAPA